MRCVDCKPVTLNLEQCKTERRGKSEAAPWEAVTRGLWIISFSLLHHEAEEGGEAVQGGVEELSTGLII